MSGSHMGARVSARSVGRYDPATDRVGISFDMESGEVLRLVIDRKSANFLMECLAGSLNGYADLCQKLRSSGIPSPEGLPKDGQLQ